MRYPAWRPPPRLRAAADLRAAEEEREAAGVPLASRSATRVSARSTLTSTCFFNLIQSFGMGTGRASGRLAPGRRACAHPERPAERPPRELALAVWLGMLGKHSCLVAQYATLQCCGGSRLDIDRLE